MKERLDVLLFERGLVKSRERARAMIMEGNVKVSGVRVLKAGTMVENSADIELAEKEIPYVSRGGLKLEAAIDYFNIDPSGKIAMDIGCSTGGFSDCLLKRGVRKLYAIDVGYGQFDWSLRNDPRIILMEKTNIRYLDADAVPDSLDLIVVDVSFISLLKVLPKALEFLSDSGEVIALVKPQFEVGKGMVGKGGVVRDTNLRASAVESVKNGAEEIGYTTHGVFESPVRGQKGNAEYFIYLKRE